jgi:cytochrome c-type biogenesis protein CcmH
MRTLRSTPLRLFAVATVVSLALALDADSHRVESLAAKLRCNCGCGDILKECSHTKCETKGSLKHELADAIQQGQTDEQILELMGTRHGATILLMPPFKGFNTTLWIVPIGLGLFGFAFVLFGRLRSKRQQIDKAQ